MKYLILVAVCLMLSGCCSTIVKDSTGQIVYTMESKGFLRNGSADIIEPDGKKIHLESSSATAGILGSLNELLGTTFNGASKAMP
jgi:hypothetical protein